MGKIQLTEPATAGTYGIPPKDFRLPEDIRLGPVRLQVADLDRSLEFYQKVIGLRPLAHKNGRAMLGAPQDVELVELIERKGARPAPSRGRTGLFHFALLLPNRKSLARFARHLDKVGVSAGSADHLVSEAFYLQDPDNLGIEVYADRPRTQWRRRGRELMMATESIDFADLLGSEDKPWDGVPPGTTMGHLHLHVGDLDLASTFYSESLGFDRMVQGYPGALFMGAGGYHHHLGTNIWAGREAKPPAADESQMTEWTIHFPDQSSLSTALRSLEKHKFSYTNSSEADDAEALVQDPWGTHIRLKAER